MEPNPYESPSEPGATASKIVKRGLGVGAILLLTPVAVAIAFGGSRAAFFAYAATQPTGPVSNAGAWAWIAGACAVFLLPPAMTLAGMIWWAVRMHRQKK